MSRLDRLFEEFDGADCALITSDINRRYFNLDVPTEEELIEIVGGVKDKRLFVFNCLLLKDGIQL